jgi:sigma-B regulation protein RsbU (phosphoserine phosphatase)
MVIILSIVIVIVTAVMFLVALKLSRENGRIKSELRIASDIQNDMLPRVVPPFSNNSWFSLFAKMKSAKEVGGDFYDFFYLDQYETKIVFVIADVSGKGIPAALFMVIAKTLIKQQMLSRNNPARALEQVNRILCVNNPRSMFVTTFICSVDLSTGIMTYANGGHNPPLLSCGNMPYQFMQLKKGIPPGIFETCTYIQCSMQLYPGDKLYLYTDGINEAINPKSEFFGNERLIQTANKFRHLQPREFDEAIRNTVSTFVEGAEQSDDITTIALSYLGATTKEITLTATLAELNRLQSWVSGILQVCECPGNIANKIEVVCEELFVNIASYAYLYKPGYVIVRLNIAPKNLVLEFEDSGIEFNPLEQTMPDTNAKLEDREIGGLGLLLTKKWMDEISYKRENDKNILTLKRVIA